MFPLGLKNMREGGQGMYKWLSVVALLPSLALAQNWQAPDAPAIALALTARTVAYADGATQQFNADGSTIYTTTNPSIGKWRVTGLQYCSLWPPSDKWSCFDVALSANGLDLRFTSSEGGETVGRYIDLK